MERILWGRILATCRGREQKEAEPLEGNWWIDEWQHVLCSGIGESLLTSLGPALTAAWMWLSSSDGQLPVGAWCPQGGVRSEPGVSSAWGWPWTSSPPPPASWTSSSGCCCVQRRPSLSPAPLSLACSQRLGLPGAGGGWVLQESYRVASNGARSCCR